MTVDFGRTAGDSAAYRVGFPGEFFSRLAAMDVGLDGHRVVDPGMADDRWARLGRVELVSFGKDAGGHTRSGVDSAGHRAKFRAVSPR